jgi:hypothetical protein
MKTTLPFHIFLSFALFHFLAAPLPAHAQSASIIDGKSLHQLTTQLPVSYLLVTGIETDSDTITVLDLNKEKTPVQKKHIYDCDRLSLSGKQRKELLASFTHSNGTITALYKTGDSELGISQIGDALESTTLLHRGDGTTTVFSIDFFRNNAPSFLGYTLSFGVEDAQKITVRGTLDADGKTSGPLTYDATREIELFRIFRTSKEDVSIRQTFHGKGGLVRQVGFTKLVRQGVSAAASPAYTSTSLSVASGSSELVLIEKPIIKPQARTKKGRPDKAEFSIQYRQQTDGTFAATGELRLGK